MVRKDFVDLDGDGLADYLDFEVDTIPGSWGPTIYTDELGRHPPRLLHTIRNGWGATVTVAYAPHTDPSVATQNPTAGKSQPSPMWLVESVTRTDLWTAPSATTTYQYRNPVRAEDWLGATAFRGFETIEATGPSGARTVETFDYALDWSGRKVETVVYQSAAEGGAAASIEQLTWSKYTLFGTTTDPVLAILPRATTTWSCADGATYSGCRANGARAASVTNWAPITPRSGGVPMLYAEADEWRLAGAFTLTSGGVSITALAPGDRHVAITSELYADAGSYRLVMTESASTDLYRSVSLGRTRLIYDSTGRVPLEERVEQLQDIWAITKRTFDMNTGLLLSVQKPMQSSGTLRTTFTYDANKAFVATTTNEVGHVTMTDHDPGTGLLVSLRGPNKKSCGTWCTAWEESRTVIDGLGRPLELWASFDDSTLGYRLTKTETYEYQLPDPTHYVRARVVVQTLIDASTGQATKVEEEIDGLGRLRKRTAYSFDGGANAVEMYEYDAAGNVAHILTPDPSRDDGTLVDYTFTHDSLGRVTNTTRPDGTGLDITFVDPESGSVPLVQTTTERVPAPLLGEPIGRTVVRTDAFGRQIQVKELLGDGGYAVTTYEHDAADRLVKIIDADGYITDLAHDFAGNRTSVVRGGRTWTYRYDLNNNMIQQVAPHPKGVVPSLYTISTRYDALDRISSQYAGTRDLLSADVTRTQANAVATYTYDINTTQNGAGRLGAVAWRVPGSSAVIRSVALGYDAQGNVTSETRGFDLRPAGYPFAASRTTTRKFNAANQVTEIVHPDGTTPSGSTKTITTYDRRGTPRDLIWQPPGASATLLARIERNVAGLPLYQAGAHLYRYWQYDRLGRVISDHGSSAAGQTHREDLTYFGAGDVRLLTTYRPGMSPRTFTFGYDAQHQLATARDDAGYTAGFTYSPGGRLDTAQVAAPTLAPNVHRRNVVYDYTGSPDPEALDALLDAAGTYASYAYSSAGGVTTRITRDGTWRFRYDGFDRQRVVINADGTQELAFYGHRADRWLALSLTSRGAPQQLRWWFDETEIWLAPSGTVGAVTKTWAHASLGTPIARIENRTSLEYTLHNGLGHLMSAVAPSGAVNAFFIYGPFGEVLAQAGDVANHLRRFNGKDYDAASGLAYYGYRYYDSQSLQFTRGDPMYRFAPDLAFAEPRRMNLYAFSLNNPVRYLDPDGADAIGRMHYTRALLTTDHGRAHLKRVAVGAARITADAAVDLAENLPGVGTAISVVKFGAAVATGDVDGMIEHGVDVLMSGAPGGKVVGKGAKYLAKKGAKGVKVVKSAKKAKKAKKVAKAKEPGKRKRRFSKKDRDAGLEKSKDANGTARCEYCGEEMDPKPGKPNSYEADHRTAFAEGGESTADNLAPACKGCNRKKGKKKLGTGPDEFLPPLARPGASE